MGTGG
jgi:hypothetical protein